MKILGVDWGEKRLGLAISQDPKWAFPWKILEVQNFTQTIEDISAIVEAEKIDCLVIGLPLGLDGKDTPQTSRVREVAADLGNVLHIPVEIVDERLTSEAAKELHKESGKSLHSVDAQAAAQILQTYIAQKQL